MKDINNLTKEDIKKIEDDLLEAAAGGTIHESCELATALLLSGRGAFVKNNPNRRDIVDIEGIQEYLSQRGYKFVPGYGDQHNVFIGQDGLPYGNDYIIYLIKENKL